jgi:hypothetical protein
MNNGHKLEQVLLGDLDELAQDLAAARRRTCVALVESQSGAPCREGMRGELHAVLCMLESAEHLAEQARDIVLGERLADALARSEEIRAKLVEELAARTAERDAALARVGEAAPLVTWTPAPGGVRTGWLRRMHLRVAPKDRGAEFEVSERYVGAINLCAAGWSARLGVNAMLPVAEALARALAWALPEEGPADGAPDKDGGQ